MNVDGYVGLFQFCAVMDKVSINIFYVFQAFCGYKFSFLLSKYPTTELLAHAVGTCLTLYCCYAKSLQSCLTLRDPIPGILQARTLEWVAISFPEAKK